MCIYINLHTVHIHTHTPMHHSSRIYNLGASKFRSIVKIILQKHHHQAFVYHSQQPVYYFRYFFSHTLNFSINSKVCVRVLRKCVCVSIKMCTLFLSSKSQTINLLNMHLYCPGKQTKRTKDHLTVFVFHTQVLIVGVFDLRSSDTRGYKFDKFINLIQFSITVEVIGSVFVYQQYILDVFLCTINI